ncbi:carboxypeptidase-like regulatory domain-containing protein [Hymenobacter baengnokdamensis]|uniref:carboxypeptidase-like regulatory domain-containing protein n=1 Tax=Hymenobacter baengnokdamensis TaxID=2615203 RepID=UPI001244B9F7|nr:carboxypeptidase-like regulatory domain-containing protein [Hymenobacter baengnokdamensis]
MDYKKKVSVAFLLLLMLTTACMKVPARLPSSKYIIKVFPKKYTKSNPIISGHTDELYPDGSYRPIGLAYISVGKQGVKSDNDGNYSARVSPGKYDVSVRIIGYQPIVVKDVRISKKDSVRIDFHLSADTTKL